MNADNPAYSVPEKSERSGPMLRVMVSIGLICALMIVMTFQGTAPIIKKKKAEALEKAIFQVLPGMETKKTFKLDQNDKLVELVGEEQAEKVVYAGYDKDGKLVGLVLEGSGMGFADVIRILYGYDPARQTLVGFYVLETKETPGLGDKIEKVPHFLANFEALDVALTEDGSAIKNPVVTVKQGAKKNAWEIDGITGATISSRAVGNIINASTQEWMPLIYKNREVFMDQTAKN